MSDTLRQKVSHYMLETELLQHELRQILPILQEKNTDPILARMLQRLEEVLRRVETAASGV